MKDYYSTRNFNDETLNKIFSTLKMWTEFIQNTINFLHVKTLIFKTISFIFFIITSLLLLIAIANIVNLALN